MGHVARKRVRARERKKERKREINYEQYCFITCRASVAAFGGAGVPCCLPPPPLFFSPLLPLFLAVEEEEGDGEVPAL